MIAADGTRLGNFVRSVLDRNYPTVKLHLATATFFRGDRKIILSKEFNRTFVQFDLPWDEHFASLGIEKLDFDFLTYEQNPIPQVVAAIAAEPNEKHLIILPGLTRRFRTSDALCQLLHALYDVYPRL